MPVCRRIRAGRPRESSWPDREKPKTFAPRLLYRFVMPGLVPGIHVFKR
jgi:hypothetical protein